MSEISTKPYLLRAIYEWCCDCGFTPYLNVRVDASTRVPMEYVKNNEIVLNISTGATRNLTIDNDMVQFSARFNGVSREIKVPISNVAGIFARENAEGMMFPLEPTVASLALKDAPRAALPDNTLGKRHNKNEARPDSPPPPGTDPSTPKPSGGKSHLKVVK
ncbi:MAG: ClpXP protease specificity-enhancing factor [Burkholderiales bacterium]